MAALSRNLHSKLESTPRSDTFRIELIDHCFENSWMCKQTDQAKVWEEENKLPKCKVTHKKTHQPNIYERSCNNLFYLKESVCRRCLLFRFFLVCFCISVSWSSDGSVGTATLKLRTAAVRTWATWVRGLPRITRWSLYQGVPERKMRMAIARPAVGIP